MNSNFGKFTLEMKLGESNLPDIGFGNFNLAGYSVSTSKWSPQSRYGVEGWGIEICNQGGTKNHIEVSCRFDPLKPGWGSDYGGGESFYAIEMDNKSLSQYAYIGSHDIDYLIDAHSSQIENTHLLTGLCRGRMERLIKLGISIKLPKLKIGGRVRFAIGYVESNISDYKVCSELDSLVFEYDK